MEILDSKQNCKYIDTIVLEIYLNERNDRIIIYHLKFDFCHDLAILLLIAETIDTVREASRPIATF